MGVFDGIGVRVLVGQGVIEGVTGDGVLEGQGVGERVGVGERYCVAVGRVVLVGLGVTVGIRVQVGIGVAEGQGVRVGVFVLVGVMVGVGVKLGTAVGGSPWTVKRPLRFHVIPAKIWTSYSPDSHSCGPGSQSVKPIPPEPPFQGIVS